MTINDYDLSYYRLPLRSSLTTVFHYDPLLRLSSITIPFFDHYHYDSSNDHLPLRFSSYDRLSLGLLTTITITISFTTVSHYNSLLRPLPIRSLLTTVSLLRSHLLRSSLLTIPLTTVSQYDPIFYDHHSLRSLLRFFLLRLTTMRSPIRFLF